MEKLLSGAGLGFRRDLLKELNSHDLSDINFFEIAPENWLGVGGQYADSLKSFTERFPFVCHGLSLSIGSADPLDLQLLKNIKLFMQEHQIQLYTEHLSWCSFNGHLYDLLPIPCTEEAVHWVSDRIKQAQDILEMRIGIENASYYFTPPSSSMNEQDFINAIVNESGCLLHLDVNNIYVNSQNFKFDPIQYLKALPLDKVCYIHVAGHYAEKDGLLVDTHGADVIDPVWDLLKLAFQSIPTNAKELPTCLERDFNFFGLAPLLNEVRQIKSIQGQNKETTKKRA